MRHQTKTVQNGDVEGDRDGGEGQNVVRFANCTLQNLEIIVEWSWQIIKIPEKMATEKGKKIFVEKLKNCGFTIILSVTYRSNDVAFLTFYLVITIILSATYSIIPTSVG